MGSVSRLLVLSCVLFILVIPSSILSNFFFLYGLLFSLFPFATALGLLFHFSHFPVLVVSYSLVFWFNTCTCVSFR